VQKLNGLIDVRQVLGSRTKKHNTSRGLFSVIKITHNTPDIILQHDGPEKFKELAKEAQEGMKGG
jgi:hypothetical protein